VAEPHDLRPRRAVQRCLAHPDAADVIVVSQVTKRLGSTMAIADVTFGVRRGTVVALLGPNGAGKTTTIRVVLGLLVPDRGTVRLALADARGGPPRVGMLLDGPAGVRRGSRTAPASRGMRQRWDLDALLEDQPDVLVLDDPATGLDADGLAWLQRSLRDFVQTGKAALVTGRRLVEVEPAADEVIVLDHGRVVRLGSVAELRAGLTRTASIRVRTPHARRLAEALAAQGHAAVHLSSELVRVHDMSAAEVGWLASAAEVTVYELLSEATDLDATLGLT